MRVGSILFRDVTFLAQILDDLRLPFPAWDVLSHRAGSHGVGWPGRLQPGCRQDGTRQRGMRLACASAEL